MTELIYGYLLMIDLAIKAIARQLNLYIHQQLDIDEDAVVLSAPFDSDGGVASNVNGKLVVFLANVNKDTMPYNAVNSTDSSGTSSFSTAPSLYLNLYVLIASCFEAARYEESVKLLSHAVTCFQEHPVIDKYTHPELSDGIEKLMLDIENIEFSELSNIWSVLGGNYLPSILYKVRMVSISSNSVKSRLIKVGELDSLVSK